MPTELLTTAACSDTLTWSEAAVGLGFFVFAAWICWLAMR